MTDDELDRWLAGLLPQEPGLALVAVGSHGRGERAPGSDLDLVLVHDGRRDIAAVADGLWYPIWDRRLALDHSVRTVREVLAAADADLKVALGLLDARLVAGDAALFAGLMDKVREQWRKRAPVRLRALFDAADERHERFGDVAFLLEPDLKEGRGGLRDVHALRAMAAASPVVSVDERAERAGAFLLAVRRALGATRLTLEEQDRVAAELGLGDADELLLRVSCAARTVAWCTGDARRRVESWLAGPPGRRLRRESRVGRELVLRDGEVWLTPDARVGADESLTLRAAAASARTGAPLAPAALARLVAEAPAPRTPWPAGALGALVALLGAGPAAVPVLETLDQHGLWERMLPAWRLVRGRPQRNPLHRFTVDRHLWETAANATALVRSVERPDLLLVAALLHDIGKGVTGRDHTDAGVELVGSIGADLGFAPDDVAVLADLVRHHLLLADVATRRDLSDPSTVEAVAAAVGDRLRLRLLAALTEADGRATGPAAWSPWKASLVGELVRRVELVLAGRPLPEPPALDVPSLPASGLLVAPDATGVTVAAPDRPGLFSLVAGTLAWCGVDVHAATVGGDGRVAVERFELTDDPRDVDWSRVEQRLASVLAGTVDLGARLAERERSSRFLRRRAPAAAPVVLVEAGEAQTVVEVRTADEIGVLWRITAGLADLGLDVVWARVSTLGAEVVDAFAVRGPADPAAIRAHVEEALAG